MSFETFNPDLREFGIGLSNLAALHGPESNLSDFRLCFESIDLSGAGHAVYKGGVCVEVDIPVPDEYTFSSHPAEISRWVLRNYGNEEWVCYVSKTRVGPNLKDSPIYSELMATDLVLERFMQFMSDSRKSCHEEQKSNSAKSKVLRIANGFKILQVFAGEVLMGNTSRYFTSQSSD